ncbi:MAG TPA: biotin/lipoyl-binding protein, partial [Gemmatimonadales bacterium]|nr:biotin/lipoyl-binding protein [Gemmatimonadales bacterium]
MRLTTPPIAALALVLALGCSHKAGGGAPRVPVTVARAEQRPVPYEILATGVAEPMQTVSVQSQVTGVLVRVTFHEGDEVAAGQLLFQIDPRPFQAALEQAQAMLARDAAQAQSAALDAARYAELVKQDYVTKSDYDARRASAVALQATVRADSA